MGIWNFCYLRRSGDRPCLTYAHSPNVNEADLIDKAPYRSNNNDFLMSVLINEGAPGNMASYYEMAHAGDLISRRNLLFLRKRLFGEDGGSLFIRRSDTKAS